MDLLDWAGLAATTAGAALLYTLTGFGFAILAAPLFLLFVDPQRAIQLVIIISTALSFVALPGLWRAITPWLLLRLALGSLAGLPFGLIAFHYADPFLVRLLVGATILGFAVLLELRRRRPDGPVGTFAIRPVPEVATGAVSGIATALVGMAGPPVPKAERCRSTDLVITRTPFHGPVRPQDAGNDARGSHQMPL